MSMKLTKQIKVYRGFWWAWRVLHNVARQPNPADTLGCLGGCVRACHPAQQQKPTAETFVSEKEGRKNENMSNIKQFYKQTSFWIINILNYDLKRHTKNLL